MSFFEPSEIDHDSILEELKPTLMRNKLLIVVLFLSIVIGVYGYLLYKSDQYQSNALVLVMLGRENSQAPITAENSSIFTDGVRAEEINSYVRLLASHSLIEESIDAVGLERFYAEAAKPEGLIAGAKYEIKKVAKVVKAQVDNAIVYVGLRPDLSDKEKIVKLIKKSLSVARERESNVITISLRLGDPELAADYLDHLIELYANRHIAARKNDNIRIAFENQTERYRSQLVDMRNKMMGIRKEWGITSVNEQRTELVVAAIRAESDLKQLQAELDQISSKQKVIKVLMSKTPVERRQFETKMRNPTIELLNEQLALMRIERAETGKRYDEGSKVLNLMDAKIKDIEGFLAAEAEQVTKSVVIEPNPLRDEQFQRGWIYDVESKSTETGIKHGITRVDDLNKQIERLNEGANILEIVQLEYTVLENRFKLNASRLEQAKIKQELDTQKIANIALIGGPTRSYEPVAPRRLLIMAVGTVAAFILSLALTLLKEWIGARVYGRREIEKIPGVQYLGKFRLYN